ncbi:MAG: MBL fold metallo-hydrolase [Bdellovibrio sp.]|nr:MBL fold metallo-hydrolase [Bdellovibrio sp.]
MICDLFTEMRPLFFVFFGILFCSELRASPENCASLSLTRRLGSEACWAKYPLAGGDFICVPKRLFHLWLKSDAPTFFCTQPELKWKLRASFENSTHAGPKEKKKWKVQTITRLTEIRTSIRLILIRSIEKMRENLSSQLAPADRLGMARSLILDEKNPDSPIPLLRILGFVHVASASGIHLYALATWIEKCVLFFSKKTGIPLSLAIWINRGLSFGFCFWVWLLSGARLGLLRPSFVLLIKAAARIGGLEWRRYFPLLFALVLEVFISFSDSLNRNPKVTLAGLLSEVLSGGRWVYALAIGGGMIGYQRTRNSHLGMALGSWVAVAVFEGFTEGFVSLFTPLVSLITLPFICLGVYPTLFLSFLTSQTGPISAQVSLVHSITLILNELILGIAKLSLLPGNLWLISQKNILISGILTATVLIFIKSKEVTRGNYLCIFLILGAFVFLFKVGRSRTTVLTQGREQPVVANLIEQLDVGQGDAALVQYSGTSSSSPEWGLIDAGSFRTLGETHWIKIFFERKISSLSWVVLTHLDEDHSGGLLRLLKLIRVQTVLSSSAELETDRGKRLSQKLKEFGTSLKAWNSGGFPFPFIESKESPLSKEPNARMSAVWIPLRNGGSYLNAGDATSAREKIILPWVEGRLRSHPGSPRILKVSHHGSKTSTDSDFLKRLAPTTAWVSAGLGNSYGHPHPRVLKDLAQAEVPVFRTDLQGRLTTAAGHHRRPRSLRLPKKLAH